MELEECFGPAFGKDVLPHVLDSDATTSSIQAKVKLGPTAFWTILAQRRVGTRFVAS
jgi:hypothetical protein